MHEPKDEPVLGTGGYRAAVIYLCYNYTTFNGYSQIKTAQILSTAPPVNCKFRADRNPRKEKIPVRSVSVRGSQHWRQRSSYFKTLCFGGSYLLFGKSNGQNAVFVLRVYPVSIDV